MSPSTSASRIRSILVSKLCFAGPMKVQAAAEPYARGSDQVYWVPTQEQALRMSRDAGRSILLMGCKLWEELGLRAFWD